uniref:Uncharacterized protein n=3 Tax=Opuntia streptacantha TaxID=393608 RepID=A0A7C9B3Q6_OPUST
MLFSIFPKQMPISFFRQRITGDKNRAKHLFPGLSFIKFGHQRVPCIVGTNEHLTSTQICINFFMNDKEIHIRKILFSCILSTQQTIAWIRLDLCKFFRSLRFYVTIVELRLAPTG